MSGFDLEFRIDGPEAAVVADELSRWLADEFGHEPRRRTPDPGSLPTPARFKADPVAVTAVILAVPGAILATLELAERLKIKEKVERLIAWAKSKVGDNARIWITLLSPKGRSVSLPDAESSDVMALAAEAKDDARRSAEDAS